jgi:crotonobetainyl-CoA:carnitine CoA-transferase CaiB-like acyl-CoA transferase
MGAINTIDRVVDHPQVKARGVLVPSEHPTAGKVRVVGPPVRLSETPGGVRAPAPLLGEHTNAVLRAELGLDDKEIDRLHRLGAIGPA